MIDVTFRRLLTRGDIPESGGGLYNPSVIAEPDGRLRILVRREVDYTWKQPSFPTFIDWDTRTHETVSTVGFTGRIEDCRLFQWQGQLLVTHVDYLCPNGRVAFPVQQRLSVIDEGRLLKWDDWILPLPMQRMEKNWVLASNGDDLFCVYSLDPFVVCRRVAPQTWAVCHRYASGLTAALGKEPHNSTHLLPFDDGYLGFWHCIKAGTRSTYVTGAYWLDADLRLVNVTPAFLDGSWVQQDVYKPGVCYVSSAVIKGHTLHLFYGEGDAHSGVATLPVESLRSALGRSDGFR
jgi:hypothetical protein